MTKLVECVPNFSEGRNTDVIQSICQSIAAVAGVKLLDVDPGAATNRTVVTFVGAPERVVEAAFQGIKKAAELIDMSKHHGEHARQGATDVCPFIPVSDMTMEECVALSHQLGQRVGSELGIPVYLYEAAATRPERRNLSDIRAGEYEALPEKLQKPEWQPDYGPAEFKPKAGATVIGARQFLIAYNINLNTKNVKIAKQIGSDIREKGRSKKNESGKKIKDDQGNAVREPGLFKECKATGWYIEEYRCAQVTMNLTDYHVTPPHLVFDKVCELATHYGARVTGSELVGLIPREAMLMAGRYFLKKQGLTSAVPERELIEAAIMSMGLDQLAEFDPKKKVIEYRLAAEETGTRLTQMTLTDFSDELSSNSPAPGGGSVSALAASLSCGLSAMVAALSFEKKGFEERRATMEKVGLELQMLKDLQMKAVDDDTESFNQILAAIRLPKGTPAEVASRDSAIQAATKLAIQIPLEVLKRTIMTLELTQTMIDQGNPNSLSDAAVGGLMARAAAFGTYYNVLINLPGITDQAWAEACRSEADNYLAQADALGQSIQLEVLTRLRQKLDVRA
jgi:glutamate formiminotransferase/formiminotetrahydrofolate cyclodeaminase